MTIPEIEEILRVAEAATQGPWLERNDGDYYQGGLYLGYGPQKYVPDPERGGNKLVSCSPGEQECFSNDVCRVCEPWNGKNFNAKFIAMSRTTVPLLCKELIEAKRRIELLTEKLNNATDLIQEKAR